MFTTGSLLPSEQVDSIKFILRICCLSDERSGGVGRGLLNPHVCINQYPLSSALRCPCCIQSECFPLILRWEEDFHLQFQGVARGPAGHGGWAGGRYPARPKLGLWVDMMMGGRGRDWVEQGRLLCGQAQREPVALLRHQPAFKELSGSMRCFLAQKPPWKCHRATLGRPGFGQAGVPGSG